MGGPGGAIRRAHAAILTRVRDSSETDPTDLSPFPRNLAMPSDPGEWIFFCLDHRNSERPR